jgi:hypothetical protein
MPATSYIIPRPISYDIYFKSLMLQGPLSFEAGRVEDGQGLWQTYLCATFPKVLSLPF